MHKVWICMLPWVLLTRPTVAFIFLTSPVTTNPTFSSRPLCPSDRIAGRDSMPKISRICSTKCLLSSNERQDEDGPVTTNNTNKNRSGKATADSNSSNSSRTGATSSQPSRRPPLSSAATPTPTTTTRREEPNASTKEDSLEADMHVLVPVKDVVQVPLADISQAAADSLGGSEAARLSLERLCNTLESVFRTEFSLKVDRANAGVVLGGRPYGGNGAGRAAATASDGNERALQLAGRATEKDSGDPKNSSDPRTRGRNGRGAWRLGSQDSSKSAGDNAKRSMWRRGFMRRERKSDGVDGEKEGSTAAAAVGATGGVRLGRQGVGGKRRNGNGNAGADSQMAAEEECVPLLELVEELVRDAMFSPISNRDVTMSQALAAEFPTAARVRPVFGNLADVYGLLHRRPDGEVALTRDGRRGNEGSKAGSQPVPLPFDGRLLVFRRGNGVEETTGRLLLKKLDYLQSNAVGWLSQFVTDTIKGWQEQGVMLVDSCVRDIARRKDGVLRSCVEGAIAFGLERDTLAKFLPVANETELALKEQEVIDEALEALRSSARRGPVNLQRYGMRYVNVKLKEFSEGGAWPPEDDSWFWDTSETVKTGELDGQGGAQGATSGGQETVDTEKEVPSAVLPRVTLASVLSGQTTSAGVGYRPGMKKNGRRNRSELEANPRSILSRLLSRCTVKEPTYDEVVVVYYKRSRRSRFRPPPALAFLWKVGKGMSKRARGVEQVDNQPGSSDDAKGAGLGLQLRVYRGVPLVSLNAITPDKKVEVRPQTALRLDLNSLVGLGLVLANLRFDSPVLVVAATVSVVLLVVRTVVGYLNARIRVESFVSRDILDKTMGSNVPVLRHLAEEAAQQKSRHVALVYAALLQCALDNPGARGSSGRRRTEWGSLPAVSMACVSRHCGAIMKACVGLPLEAEIDVSHWLRELENLKILRRVDAERERGGRRNGDDSRRSLPLALEGPDALTTTAAAAAATASTTSMVAAKTQGEFRPPPTGTATDERGSTIAFFCLLDPDAAFEALKLRWSDLVEPPAGVGGEQNAGRGATGSSFTDSDAPWVRRLGLASGYDGGGGSGEDSRFVYGDLGDGNIGGGVEP